MLVRDLPRPRNWQDFEDLTCDLFRVRWKSTLTSKNGRSGQRQAGVDVFGLKSDGHEWFGVQCKKKSDQEVSRSELENEVGKAKAFNPRLSIFVLATTAARDGKAQEWARELTGSAPFEIAVFAWEDFCEALDGQPELLRKHFPDVYPDDPSDVRSHYLRHLFDELDVVDVSKVGRGNRQGEIQLSSVYIGLDVEARVRIGEDESARHEEGARAIDLTGDEAELERILGRVEREGAEREKSSDRHRGSGEPYARRCTALEAAAAAPLRVLTGSGGSGKSTFGRYLCLCLAGQHLGDTGLNLAHLNGRWAGAEPALQPWPHGELLPFFVELRRFVRDESFPAEDEHGHGRHLTAYLAKLGPTGADMGPLVLAALDRGALLVLDGLDETPSAERVRDRLKQVIEGFVRTYRGCRVLVTSRPYAYQRKKKGWRLDDAGFVEASLAPLDRPKIERFVSDAYIAFLRRNKVESERPEELSRDLLEQLRSQETLGPLARQPLMLTMMTDLHASRGGRLPGARAALFEGSVDLLFDRWNERRFKSSVADLVGMSEEQIRSALELLAFRAHRDGGRKTEQASDVPESELLQALVDTRKRYGIREAFGPEEICDYLNERSGILIAESPSLYRFPHRFFQEFLAACHLDRFPGKRQACLDTDPGLWREVLLFLAGRLADGDRVWELIRQLAQEPPPDDVAADDRRFETALFAALAVRENGLWLREEADHRPKLEDVRSWLCRTVELGALDAKDRALAGQILGLLGDDRAGVGLAPNGLPDIVWVEIPGGDFVMGSEMFPDEKPEHREHVHGFRISRYPLTHAQYQAFVDDGGYSKQWRRCWTAAGWKWKGVRQEPASEGFPFDLPNHPRVGVSWYEAVAYCSWLSEKTDTKLRLPTEAEWERAVRGGDGREYPWGATFDAERGNFYEAGLGFTTAVGLFPSGESPGGPRDMGVLDGSGNVWEWCSTKWRDSYEKKADDRLAGTAVRVLRGGSFAGLDLNARCAYRGRGAPYVLSGGLGFRLVAPI